MEQQGYAGGGAVDLSQMAQVGPETDGGVPDPLGLPPSATAVVDAPLIVQVTEANIDAEMALSATVPIILTLVSSKSLASKQVLEVLSALVREEPGTFQLATVDVETSPQLAAAFQATAVPATFALLAGRPIPLFEGVPSPTQAQSLLAEILQVAPQMGVTGRIRVAEEDLETPMPAEHIPAREAEEAGDWAGAVKAWKKVLASNPADKEARLALARAKFEKRYEKEMAAGGADADSNLSQSPTAAADQLFASGDEAAAFDVLLEALTSADDKDAKEEFRKALVGLFPIAADTAAVKVARGKLATHLMV